MSTQQGEPNMESFLQRLAALEQANAHLSEELAALLAARAAPPVAATAESQADLPSEAKGAVAVGEAVASNLPLIPSPQGPAAFTSIDALTPAISATGNPSIGVLTSGTSGETHIPGSFVNGYGVYAKGISARDSGGNVVIAYGLYGSSDSGAGVYGHATGSGTGVVGNSDAGDAVEGTSNSGIGVVGRSGNNLGVWGHSVGSYGVSGSSTSGVGVVGSSSTNVGVWGQSTSNIGVAGNSTSGVGVQGYSIDLYGVWGYSTNNVGILGASGSGTGVWGISNGSGTGVWGNSNGGIGVQGYSNSSVGVSGSSQDNYGVNGRSTSGVGVFGSSQDNYGVWGTSTNNTGVSGQSNGGVGVSGSGIDNYGVWGISTSSTGVYGQSTSGVGVSGTSSDNIGVSGTSRGNIGVSGIGGYTGVYGSNTGGSGPGGIGVYGNSIGNSINSVGVWGESAIGTGVVGQASPGHLAGEFFGDLDVTGHLTKQGGGFKIDHPLDPANKFLSHFFVESPDMKNVYDGVVMLDAHGEAVVELPAWFEALNQEFRYQLTPLGVPGPDLYIAEEISDQRFKIAGGSPALRVCWQVTGSRKDAWAQANQLAVEREKPAEERGHYLNPELYGYSLDRSIAEVRHPQSLRRFVQARQQTSE